MEQLNEFLVKLRNRKGLNKQEMGKLIGVNSRTIYSWECGEKQPSPESLRRLHAIATQEGLGDEFAAIVFHQERMAA